MLSVFHGDGERFRAGGLLGVILLGLGLIVTTKGGAVVGLPLAGVGVLLLRWVRTLPRRGILVGLTEQGLLYRGRPTSSWDDIDQVHLATARLSEPWYTRWIRRRYLVLTFNASDFKPLQLWLDVADLTDQKAQDLLALVEVQLAKKTTVAQLPFKGFEMQDQA